jgi:hypothetical protein
MQGIGAVTPQGREPCVTQGLRLAAIAEVDHQRATAVAHTSVRRLRGDPTDPAAPMEEAAAVEEVEQQAVEGSVRPA